MIKKYKISHLDCASCAQKIEDMLNKQDDIIECSLSFASGVMIIESDKELNIDSLKSIIQKVEPDVMIEDKEKNSHQPQHHEHEEGCGCGHEQHEHEEGCGCGHEHHEHEEGCGCG
ncbi:MAG: heavy metal-associated domain-containing protein, partial [Coprobacillus sp.]